MKQHTPGQVAHYPRWEVFERKLSDGSSVFDLYFMLREGTSAGGAVIEAISEGRAYAAMDAMNAAADLARGTARWA